MQVSSAFHVFPSLPSLASNTETACAFTQISQLPMALLGRPLSERNTGLAAELFRQACRGRTFSFRLSTRSLLEFLWLDLCICPNRGRVAHFDYSIVDCKVFQYLPQCGCKPSTASSWVWTSGQWVNCTAVVRSKYRLEHRKFGIGLSFQEWSYVVYS